MIGRVELARYRALEALSRSEAGDPDPKRSANIPPDQGVVLKLTSREEETSS
jgi:hypothetical protein